MLMYKTMMMLLLFVFFILFGLIPSVSLINSHHIKRHFHVHTPLNKYIYYVFNVPPTLIVIALKNGKSGFSK